MRFLRLPMLTLIAALAILLPSGALARTHYFCHMAEKVMPSCCCAEQPAPHDAEQPAQARTPDCCERLVSPERAGTRGVDDAALHVPTAALAIVIEPYLAPRLESGRVGLAPRGGRGPPGAGPPLFIVHCALLS